MAEKSDLSGDPFSVVHRSSKMFQNDHSDLPCIFQNLGLSKLLITNTMHTDEKTTYVIDIPEDEKFISFAQFNEYEDLCLYPKGLRIECCSKVCFITASRKGSDIQHNRINILFVDPFFAEIECALFRSSTHFDHEMLREHDCIIRNIITSSMGRKDDKAFKTYIWTQLPEKIIRSKLMKQVAGAVLEDSDNEQEAIDKANANNEEETNIKSVTTFEGVPMLLNKKDFIYYVTKTNGKCDIIEGNPRDPYMKNH